LASLTPALPPSSLSDNGPSHEEVPPVAPAQIEHATQKVASKLQATLPRSTTAASYRWTSADTTLNPNPSPATMPHPDSAPVQDPRQSRQNQPKKGPKQPVSIQTAVSSSVGEVRASGFREILTSRTRKFEAQPKASSSIELDSTTPRPPWESESLPPTQSAVASARKEPWSPRRIVPQSRPSATDRQELTPLPPSSRLPFEPSSKEVRTDGAPSIHIGSVEVKIAGPQPVQAPLPTRNPPPAKPFVPLSREMVSAFGLRQA